MPESLEYIMGNMIDIFKFCIVNKPLCKTEDELMDRIKRYNCKFYTFYHSVCVDIVKTDDITPLLIMLNTLHKVEQKDCTLDTASTEIQNLLNKVYMNPVLNSNKLVSERQTKGYKEC